VQRRIFLPTGTMESIEFIIDRLRTNNTNANFFASMNP
jgi:transcription termination factor Rho